MKMVFKADEVCEIVKQHVIQEWGVPEGSIVAVKYAQADRRVEVEIKTAEGGGPYRSVPKHET